MEKGGKKGRCGKTLSQLFQAGRNRQEPFLFPLLIAEADSTLSQEKKKLNLPTEAKWKLAMIGNADCAIKFTACVKIVPFKT